MSSHSPGSQEHDNRQPDPILEITDTNVTYTDGESYVLEDASVSIHRDEILGIVGESGSGKSMFASAILDAVPDPGVLTGQLRYNGPDGTVDILGLSDEQLRAFRWEEIAMVFQGAMHSFNPTMKIKTHFTETLQSHDRSVSEGMSFARELLESLYLEPERVLNAYPHELSGGMQQRALIALSMVLNPEVLIMDEPTAALDLLMQRSILSLLHDLQAEYDLTIVFITHDLPLVAGIADRMAIIYAFEFVEIGPRDAIISNAAHPYTRALLQATPNINSPLEAMESIEGQGPAPANVPSGCRFHPRCPVATEECESVDPALEGAESNRHRVACHHVERAREELTVSTDEAGAFSATESTTRPSTDGEPLLELSDLEVHFESSQGLPEGLIGDPDVVRAVDGVSLSIEPQDLVCLLGESGCGKTTLGKAMIGLQEPTGGSITFRGDPLDEHDDARAALQIIHQDPSSALNPNRRIVDILSEPLLHTHPNASIAERRSRITSLLERIGMTPADAYIERYPHQLSGGEQQRVVLSRALLMDPDAVLADEAISAVDVSLRIEIMDLLLELQAEFETSYLFISHDLSNARYITEHAGGRIAVMYLGEIVEIGTAQRLLTDPRHPYTEVLRWATPALGLDTDGDDEPPVREIDVPDPINPPSGCRFHTRCPVARETCVDTSPELRDCADVDGAVACFRSDPDHQYWESEPLDGASERPE